MSATFLTQDELLAIAKDNAEGLLSAKKVLASKELNTNVLGVIVKIRQTIDGRGTTVSAKVGNFPQVISGKVTQADASAAQHVLDVQIAEHKNITGIEILSLIKRGDTFEVVSSKAGEMCTPGIINQILR